MENIIPLILFTYPGAVSEYVYRKLSENRAGDVQKDEIFRVARDFFLSALVTALCLVITHPGKGTLDDLMQAVRDQPFIWLYLILSLGLSAAVGLLWFLSAELVFRIRNRYREARGRAVLCRRHTVWQDLLEDPTIPHENPVFAVHQNGVRLRAGILWEFPLDLARDPGLILMHTDEVEQQLNLPEAERTLITYPVASYLEPASGFEIQIYDGTAIARYIYDCANGAIASSAGPAPSVSSD